MSLYDDVKVALAANANKLPVAFVNEQIEQSTVTFLKLTPNMRVCIIRLQSGHEVIGIAQVLDASNDVEEIGNNVALQNATNELWKTFGAIALA
jgi:hypothetical protein